MLIEEIKEHTLWQSIFWHLFPGILGGIVYCLLVDFVSRLGFPTIVALIISGSLVIIPFEMGVLIYSSKKTMKNCLVK
jgi:uncharacterized membrane protein YdcZ (DUF606 family)